MDDAKIVEVSFFGGKVLVTFADGMMALLEPGLIRRLAVDADALKPLPKEPVDSDLTNHMLRRFAPKADVLQNISGCGNNWPSERQMSLSARFVVVQQSRR